MSRQDTTVLQALYCINKYAKEYAQEASKAYDSGFGEQARLYSVKKSALYDYKEYLLKSLYEEDYVENITVHEIDGEKYYCLYVGDYSFHTPMDTFDVEFSEDVDSEGTDITDEFASNVPESELPLSEREALEHLEEAFVSANRFVTPKFIDATHGARSVGWRYLSEYPEQGMPVDEEEITESQFEEFYFEVGDVFDTVDSGEVQVVDRYGAWIRGWGFDDSVRKRPVYDVMVDGELQEDVPQHRICEDWKINIRDTIRASGVTRISSGPWNEYVMDELDDYPNLCIGDVLVFESGERARIEGIETNDCVLVFVRLAFDEDDFDEYLTPDEFYDDVEKVERGDIYQELERRLCKNN